MLNALIRFSLKNRLMIMAIAMAVIVYANIVIQQLSIDVLPDLTRPRVVLITECPGLAPEEVELLVTQPLESSVNGASGVQAVRSSSGIGLSVIYVEFDWDSDIYTARQIVQERISTVTGELPEGVHPQLGPISSLLGQIMLVGMWSEDGTTDPLELRTLADWVIRKRLFTIPGVSQVITMGGGKMQYQVLVDPHALHKYEVGLHEVEQALREGNLNVTGGYLDRDSQELLVRGLGRVRSLEDIENIVVKFQPNRSVLVRDVAKVRRGAAVKRGDSSVNGNAAVVITIQKQPGADTRQLTEEVKLALNDIRRTLPDDIVLETTYEQRVFIDYSVQNVVAAIRDGAVLVVVVLFVFLLSVRTTLITLTAIPLSVLATAIVFRWYGMSINVMTLGGLAVALGELVDDAIVDVENIFHRLKQNAQLPSPRPVLSVVYDASREVRGAIIISTILVVLIFAPLFALSGIEGRLFKPLGVAYIVSILASTLVSLTVTPVLSYYLLPKAKATLRGQDTISLRLLKWIVAPVIRLTMTPWGFSLIVVCSVAAMAVSLSTVLRMGKDFLPAFDEGAAQVNLILQPGTSLETSRRVSQMADKRFAQLLRSESHPHKPVLWFTCRTGRAENDEHVMGVNISEYVLTLNPQSGLSRDELIETLRGAVDDLPGVEVEVEQPLAHLISHMLSGVTAQIAIKLFGDDLDELRRQAAAVKAAIQDLPGIAEPVVEPATLIPQLRIELKPDQLAYYGISAADVNENIETALNGRVVSDVIDGQRSFDLLVRFGDEYRTDHDNFHRLPIELPNGHRIPLSEVARVYDGAGPNVINREDTRRRIVVRVNTRGRDLDSAVTAIQGKIADNVRLPSGYFILYGGQFEAQKSATRRILLLSLVSLAGVFVVLYMALPSTSLVLQVLLSIPLAFVGGVAALVLTDQTLSVAGMVGFISLGGIAARNGILLVSTYVALYADRGFNKQMIVEGSMDRLAPVLMTALTTGIGLLPLVYAGQLPGKEILFPVATVILGGLITSTMAEFLMRPGLFWYLSRTATERIARDRQSADSLSE